MKINVEKVWFNTMPMIGDDTDSFPPITITLEPDELLSEGIHTLEVHLKGPDGKELIALTTLEVGHAA